MTVPVSGRVPDSTLSPFQVRQKFSSRSMAGLGEFCLEYADDGSCNYSIPDITDSTTTIDSSGGFFGTVDPALFSGAGGCGSDPNELCLSGAVSPTISSTWVDSNGAIWANLSNGIQYQISSGGTVSKGSGVTPSLASGTTTVTPAQANSWAAVISQLINAGVRLGTVAELPPGSSLMPNGVIVGRNQTLVTPTSTITGSSITATFANMLKSPMFLIGGFGILAVALLAGGGRR